MISSMTGFARQERSGAFGTLVCEIRSVNHRFLDASVRLPDSCRMLESDLRQRLAGALRRGKVDGTIQHRPPVAGALTQEAIDLAVIPVAASRVWRRSTQKGVPSAETVRPRERTSSRPAEMMQPKRPVRF